MIGLAIGTQFPDLVDKPLAWWFGVIPNGRTLAHSALTAAVVIGVFVWLARRYEATPVAVAFGAGYATHLLGDSYRPILGGDYEQARFLLWPLFPPVEYVTERSLLAHLLEVSGPEIALELTLFGAVVGLWGFDGFPGLSTVWHCFEWLRGDH